MELIRPRLTDHHGIQKAQSDLDFAIQFFDEDIPLYLDPFLLWKSPSLQDQALHTAITNSFNYLNYLLKKGRDDDAITTLVSLSECQEVGLGVSKSRKGAKIGIAQAKQILNLFKDITEYNKFGFTHFEAIQLYITGISKDRVSDIACNYIKSFLVDYTIEQCEINDIPTEGVILDSIYNYQTNSFDANTKLHLPVNPKTKDPIIFTPKRWLRFNPWINYDDYFKSHCPRDEIFNPKKRIGIKYHIDCLRFYDCHE